MMLHHWLASQGESTLNGKKCFKTCLNSFKTSFFFNVAKLKSMSNCGERVFAFKSWQFWKEKIGILQEKITFFYFLHRGKFSHQENDDRKISQNFSQFYNRLKKNCVFRSTKQNKKFLKKLWLYVYCFHKCVF